MSARDTFLVQSLPGEYAHLGKHTLAGAGFISNFAFWAESGYFDTAADSKLLLHLWSLGIKEQFYLLWPRCSRGHGGANPTRLLLPHTTRFLNAAETFLTHPIQGLRSREIAGGAEE